MGALDGLRVLIKDNSAKIYSWPVIICGVDSNGNPVPFGASPASGGGGGGIPFTPPTVNGVKVVGIQEVDSSDAFTSPTGHTIAAGGLSWLFFPSSDFAGTLKFGSGSALTWPGSNGPAGRDGEPNNTLPGATITCSAGSYMVVEARPS